MTAVYIMTVTELSWRDSLNAIRGARSVANPNYGFQKQLQNYHHDHVKEVRFNAKNTLGNSKNTLLLSFQNNNQILHVVLRRFNVCYKS